MTGETDLTLSALPDLRRLYAAGAVGALRRRLLPPWASGALPAVRHRFDGAAVDIGRLAAFQRLVRAPGTDAVPPGFVHIVAFPVAMSVMTRADFPLPLLGLVHLANTVTQWRPITAGDRLDVTAWAQNLSGHHSGTRVELVTEVSVRGELRWRGLSTYLAKGVRLPNAERPERGPRSFAPPPATGVWRLPAGTGRAYAAISGDFNPIHLGAPSARALGFPRAIAHGMYLASRAFSAVRASRLEAFEWTVAFEAPVLLPSTVRFSAPAGDPDAGDDYTGWSASSGRRHFGGSVRPLSD